jgi:hypothetical protein
LKKNPSKFREGYRMNIRPFHYILDSVMDDLYGYFNSRKCIEAQQELTVALRGVVVIVVRIKINYICKMLYAIIIQCNLKRSYTGKSNSYTTMK